ncbi:SET domain-containing protein-lysine N-methyltransferase [uncultured Jatrophihabitans sp.]|uniref:SET domain-containing protein-lysine N-methyltransferase n=1 Tax=uncultured Jatrophihabitans sp. TaxID=1610747 RepID=UPI0035CC2732
MIAGVGMVAAAPIPASSVVVRFVEPVVAPAGFGGLNHSCDPTLGWTDDRTLVALDDIPAGTELTADYSTAIADPDYLLWCHCGTYRCRQVIEGGDWRIPQLQQRYAGHWHPAVQTLIEQAG